jgi:hypothetical protein
MTDEKKCWNCKKLTYNWTYEKSGRYLHLDKLPFRERLRLYRMCDYEDCISHCIKMVFNTMHPIVWEYKILCWDCYVEYVLDLNSVADVDIPKNEYVEQCLENWV